jgi:hypothetical protein
MKCETWVWFLALRVALRISYFQLTSCSSVAISMGHNSPARVRIMVIFEYFSTQRFRTNIIYYWPYCISEFFIWFLIFGNSGWMGDMLLIWEISAFVANAYSKFKMVSLLIYLQWSHAINLRMTFIACKLKVLENSSLKTSVAYTWF